MITEIVHFKTSITPQDLYHRLAAETSIELLDVRTPAEYAAVHVPGARLIPLDQLDVAAFLGEREHPEAPFYVLCQSGARAGKAIERFERAGFDRCVLVEGGTQAWVDAGLPVERGTRKVLPLMRQMQITVGIITAAGAGLALGLNPWFAIVPLVTGCGLLFAGLTGTCGMALLLARMPWNRRAGCDSGSCCETNHLNSLQP